MHCMCRFPDEKQEGVNLPSWLSTKWGLGQPPGPRHARHGLNASWTCGRQRRRNPPQRCPRPYAQSYMYMYMYVALRARLLCCAVRELASRRPLCNLGSARRRRGERVQKAGAIGGGAALSTRGAAPGRCDDACRTYRHHISTVEGFEVCLRGRRPLASRRSRTTAPSTAHATRC